MMIRERLVTLIFATSLALAGCGSTDTTKSSDRVGDLPAGTILTAAKKQLAAAEFISIKGNGVEMSDSADLEINLRFAGDTASGSIVVKGVPLELLKADGKTYVKAGKEFFGSNGSAAEMTDLIGGRWVLVEATNPTFGELVSYVSKDDFLDQLFDPDGKVTTVDDRVIDGVDCVGLTASKSTLYVDKSDGLPVSLVITDDGIGTLDFTYDKIDHAQAPPAAQIVDLTTADR